MTSSLHRGYRHLAVFSAFHGFSRVSPAPSARTQRSGLAALLRATTLKISLRESRDLNVKWAYSATFSNACSSSLCVCVCVTRASEKKRNENNRNASSAFFAEGSILIPVDTAGTRSLIRFFVCYASRQPRRGAVFRQRSAVPRF